MSSYERVTGKLRKLAGPETIEETCKAICMAIPEFTSLEDSGWDSYQEFIQEEKYEEYCILKGSLYKVLEFKREYDPEPDYCRVTHTSLTDIEFDTMYYNGGTCWKEMVEDELSNRILNQ